jgi:hypothetical protein
MANAIGNNAGNIHQNPALIEGGNLRREIRGFLATLGLALQQSNSRDPVTAKLREWHTLFCQRINSADNLQNTQNAFAQELQEILLDPFEQRENGRRTTLETPLLGSDGITYGTKSLRIALSRLPELLRYRSPTNLEDEAVFITEPHPVAACALRWLEDKGARLPSLALNMEYQRLLAQNELPEIPSRDDPRIVRLLEEQARINLRIMREREMMQRQAQEEQMQQAPVNRVLNEQLRERVLRLRQVLEEQRQPQQEAPEDLVAMDENVFALNHNPILMEGALRREITGFLATVMQMVNQSNLRDTTTTEIRNWAQTFTARVGEHADVTKAQNEFILLLQEILSDPIESIRNPNAGTTLAAPLLGSDGITYATKTLSICIDSLPEEFKRRSPIHFADAAVLTTQPHPVAAYMVRWLQEKNANIISLQVEAEYQQLINENRLPVLLTLEILAREEAEHVQRLGQEERARIRNERIQILMQQQAEQNAREAREAERFEQELLNRQVQVIQEVLVEPMEERIEGFAARQDGRVDVLAQNNQRRLRELRVRNEQFHDNIAVLQHQNIDLRAELERLDGANQELRREAIQLQISINETRIAIEERKAGWVESLLTGAAVIGICIFATWAAGSLLPAGMSAAVKPMVGGAAIAISCGQAQGSGPKRGPTGGSNHGKY